MLSNRYITLHYCVFLYLLMLTFPLQVEAAELSLEHCLARAREQNPTLRLARMDVGIATETIRQSDAALFPRLDLQAGYTAQLEAQAMKAGNMVIETQQPNYLFGSLNLNYTLYDFGRRDARRFISRTGLDLVKLGVQQQEQDTALQVIENYYTILEVQKITTAVAEELQTVSEHLRVAQALYDSGAVTRNDLLQAQVRQAATRQQLLTHRNQLENLYLHLNFLTGSPPSERPRLSEPKMPHPQQQASGRIEKLQQRPDLQALHKRIEIKKQEVSESRSAFYPELFTRLSLDYLQNDKLREQAIYGASIGIKVNLFDGLASTATRSKAIAQESRAREQVRLAEEQARLELSTASNDLTVAFERIGVTKAAILQGEENLRINRSRYQERVGTATEVFDAQTLLTKARTEHYRAQYDYHRAEARLRRSLGEL